jgi:rubredoxin
MKNIIQNVMSILNNLEEISLYIVCPKCRHRSPKDWAVSHIETKGKPKVRKSRVYFRCTVCNYLTEIFDKKLVKFIDKELWK